jgi:hypothetical protein
MATTSDIRNKVIDQLLAINDADYLLALSQMIDRSHIESPAITLTDEQKLMLSMSEADITEGRTIDQLTLHERELQWLRGK